MNKKINYLFVTMLGIGNISRIPGSIASLITTIILFLVFHILSLSPNLILFFIILIFLYLEAIISDLSFEQSS